MGIDNLISVTITKEENERIEAGIAAIEQIIKGKTINLTPDERQQYGRIGDKTENWITKVGDYMEQKPELIPFYLSHKEFVEDQQARLIILPLLNRLASIVESLDDTSKLLSADVNNAALAYYRNIKLVAQQNVPGTTHIYKDLASQFTGRRSSVPEESDEQKQS